MLVRSTETQYVLPEIDAYLTVAVTVDDGYSYAKVALACTPEPALRSVIEEMLTQMTATLPPGGRPEFRMNGGDGTYAAVVAWYSRPGPDMDVPLTAARLAEHATVILQKIARKANLQIRGA